MSVLEEVRNAHRESPTGAHDNRSDLASDREVLLAVLARVEALHSPVTVCQDCAHPTSPVCTGARYSRESHVLSVVCVACCTDGAGHQMSMCVMTHDHTHDGADRCSTIRAIYDTPKEDDRV